MSLKTLNIVLCAMFLVILGNCAFVSCSQNGDGIMENLNENNSGNEQNLPQRLPLTFGPETLDKLKSNPDFIAAYGSIPAFKTSEERENWLDNLGKVIDRVNTNFDQEMSKYFSPNDPVTTYGYSIDGVIEVGINRSITVEKPFLDEIYKIFITKASRMGIKDVPVVFVHQDNPIPGIEIEPVIRETANLSITGVENASEVNNSNGNKSGKTNSVPGFGLLGGLICLYGGWWLRKKIM